MATILAVITALGVVVTILTNLTNIARYMHERRERRGTRLQVAAASEHSSNPRPPAAATPEYAPHPELPSSATEDPPPAASLDAYIGPPSSGVIEPIPPLPLTALPQPLTSFVGRQATLAQLTALVRLPETRLVTLHGPGGIGKSRLALEAARALRPDFTDGVAFVPLDAVHDPELVLGEIAYAVGLTESATTSPLDRLAKVLQRRELLLVLDNVEGLLGSMGQVSQLLATANGLKVLVTSRTLLHLSGELSFPVPPMALPEGGEPVTAEGAMDFGGVRLFVERVRALRPDFTLDDESVGSVVNLCRRLDGLPLALELAAARLGSMTLAALVERATQRLPLLTGGPRDAPARQQTLRATIAWSHDLLSPTQRTLFARLALFDGSVYLEAIEAIFGLEPTVMDGLSSLIDASLLTRFDLEAGRLGMLETLREFALEELAKDPQLAVLKARHAHYYLQWVAGVPEALQGPRQQEWLERLRYEEGNLRTASAWFVAEGDAEGALGMAVALRPYWQRMGALDEGRRHLDQAAALPGAVAPELRASAAFGSGVLAWRQGDLAEAESLLGQALTLARTAQAPKVATAALRMLGVLAQNHADYTRAGKLLKESLELAKEQGDVEAVSNTYLSLGNVALDQDHGAAATDYYEKSLQLTRRNGDTLGEAMALDNLSVAAWYAGDLTSAERLGQEAFVLYQQLVLPSGCANIWHRNALVALGRGDLNTAEAQARLALRVRRAQGEGRGAAFILYDLARVALARKDHESAALLLAEGLGLVRPQQAPVLDLLYLEGTAAYLTQLERFDEAHVLLRVADGWRERIGAPVAPVNRKENAKLRHQVQRALAHKERKHLLGLDALARQLTEVEAVERAATALGMLGFGQSS